MTEVTRLLAQIDQGDAAAADELLPLVYDELRKLAAARLAQEKPGQTLQATALVHEAYVRLVDQTTTQEWDGRGHFFASAAEAMRRILVERARRQNAEKRGGKLARQPLHADELADEGDQLIRVSEALDGLAEVDDLAARLVKLRYFAGCSGKEAAELLEISPRTADRIWAFARSWLLNEIRDT